MKKIVWTVMLSVFLIIPIHMAAAADGQSRPVSPSLLASLRQGGYILYVRHGEANVGEDQPNLVFDDCSTQRNLSEEGKRQALRFGESIKNLQIPVQTPVQASPFCRTRQSAALAFGADRVQVDPFWFNIYKLNNKDTTSEEQARTLADLDAKLEMIPSAGMNQVVIAHSFPQGVGLGEIADFGTVIVKPRGQGKGYEIAGKLTLADWTGSQ
ncbi:histidine phosphatase family protein [Paenibacillus sp. KN14-4R]|uniref:histidine phosphatase family protein n=1 Tax=Paenibacillus sp. KN14-4R TaxID=3445773 RepID=UPI003FA01531